ncbi:MAG: endonuclease/exonuclease/phosphatase family protein [Anaerolineales bacterium]|nr:endonuclease/exonuclease/phosphatase family protein [Anaerolineales bacterium]
MNDKPTHIKLMSYNIGGGRKNLGSKFDDIVHVIKENAPDILAIQETAEWEDLSGNRESQPQRIASEALSTHQRYFGPTLSMRADFHPRKALFIHGVFNDWKDWAQGNALFSLWPFVRLGDINKSGQPENIPLYRPIYSGNRDTDPRYVILSRIKISSLGIFVLVTHLTTLVGERKTISSDGGTNEIPGKDMEAQGIREEQSKLLLGLMNEFIIKRNEPAILMGDLNATASEPCIADVLEAKGGLFRLLPKDNTPTHLKLSEPVDHILVFPGRKRIEYNCSVINDQFRASDHNPVVAEIDIYDEDSDTCKQHSPGVVRVDT